MISNTTDERKYEYLDHTADVILHSWGHSLEEAMCHLGIAMFGYMTDIALVRPLEVREIEASGHDLENLIFHFLDELLFLYGAEYFFCHHIEIVELEHHQETFRVCARGFGEVFDRVRHSQGTEIKAITMHETRIVGVGEDKIDIYVLVDI